MAVLPASKAYPRGGAPRRTYTPGAPLFAKMAMRFGGVDYARGAELPIEQMSKHKHWELWTCGKADHSTRGPFDKQKASIVDLTPDDSQDADAQKLIANTLSEIEQTIDALVGTPTASADSLSDDELERLTRPE